MLGYKFNYLTRTWWENCASVTVVQKGIQIIGSIWKLISLVKKCQVKGVTEERPNQSFLTPSIQSKPVKFKCLRTPKLFELIWSWNNPKCWICSIYPYSAMVLNLSKEWELSCRISSNFLFFQTWNLTSEKETFILDKFNFAPLHRNNWTYPHTHTHTYTCRRQVSITIHNQSLEDLGWSKQPHGKVICHLSAEKNGGKKFNLSGAVSLWDQSERLNLSGIWMYPLRTYLLFFNKEKEGFQPGHDEHLDLIDLNLSGLDCAYSLKSKQGKCDNRRRDKRWAFTQPSKFYITDSADRNTQNWKVFP